MSIYFGVLGIDGFIIYMHNNVKQASNEEDLKVIKDVLAKHFAKKVDDEMDVLLNEPTEVIK